MGGALDECVTRCKRVQFSTSAATLLWQTNRKCMTEHTVQK